MRLGKLSGRWMVFEATPVSCTFRISSTSSASSNTAQTGFSMSFSTCFRPITSFLCFSEKKIKKAASERNEDLQADYIGRMGQYSPEQLGFLDKVSKDEHTSSRACGQSRKGTWAIMKGVFVHGQCFSAEGLLSIDGMVASTVVEGSMMQELFVEYLEFTVVFRNHNIQPLLL